MELHAIVESYILNTLKGQLDQKDEKEKVVLDWYRQLAKCLLDTGIPEKGVIELMKKHPISIAWVERYYRMHKPEMIAQNILRHRHDKVEYDSLAKPRIRVTKKKISDFRQNLEIELRRIWGDHKESLDAAIKEYCYLPQDEEIAGYIKHGVKACDWAKDIFYYL